MWGGKRSGSNVFIKHRLHGFVFVEPQEVRVKMKWKISLLIFSLMMTAGMGSSIRGQDFYTRDIIDTPTAGLLPRGSYMIGLRAYSGGGVLANVGVGLMERLELGISFGGTNVIGEGDIDWNPELEFFGRYRLVDESIGAPALAVGFNSQGFGRYVSEAKRYEIKSRGFYGVLSKNYNFLGPMGIHLGANLSLEGHNKDDNKPNVFFSIHKGINSDLFLVAEYDLPITSGNVVEDLDKGVGFLNAGIRFLFDQNLLVEVDFRNINGNARDAERSLRIVYQNMF
jgi:hypothetical protein